MSEQYPWIGKNQLEPRIWQEKKTFWAAPQNYTCSYLAMFPPELPHYFIQRFTNEGDIVLDPFCGRGTTPLQAISHNRYGIGNDWNDLAYLLSKGKIANPGLEEIIDRINILENNYFKEDWKWPKGSWDIKAIFSPYTLKQLNYLKEQIDWRNDDVDAFIGMVLMGAMHGSSSGFLSISMPNTFSMSPNYIKKYIKKHKLKRPERDVFEIIRNRCKRYLRLGKLPGKGEIIYGDVRKINENSEIKKESVKLIFTSPPYLKVIKYGLYNWIRLWWLIGEYNEIDEKLDDGHGIDQYCLFIEETLTSLFPLIDKESGMICLVIGDVGELNLAKMIWDKVASKFEYENSRGEAHKLKLLGIVEDRIPDNQKVTKIWNSEEDKSGKSTKIDRILILSHENAKIEALMTNDNIDWSPIKVK